MMGINKQGKWDSYCWAEVLVIFFELIHKLQVLLFLLQLGHTLLTFLQPLLRACQLITKPLILLAQPPDLKHTDTVTQPETGEKCCVCVHLYGLDTKKAWLRRSSRRH